MSEIGKMVLADRATIWQGRRVLLTGHTGFKGAWLSLWLASLGARVTGLALAPERGEDLFHAAGIGGLVTSFIGDIRDREILDRVVAAADPEVILHLAAQPLVRASYDRPLETFSVNVMGTLHVLEAARRARNLQAVVVITTDKVYRNDGAGRSFTEDDALGGEDPYSASKAAAEIAAQCWRSAELMGRDAPIVTARAGNVIGGGDWSADRLVPDAVRAFTAGHPLTLRMPHAIRPWQHVVEPLEGYLRIAEAMFAGNRDRIAPGYNLGPSIAQCATVGEVAARLCVLWGEGARVEIGAAPTSKKESAALALDSARAGHDLGWMPQRNLDQALAATVAWYKAATSGAHAADLRALMLDQIGPLLRTNAA